MKTLLHSPWVHIALVVTLSAGFESLFVQHSMNLLDEGWPLVAARALHEGGTLYREVFWVFPPGHVLSAWIAYALDPPGVVFARSLYAAFAVALCAACYVLGRRLMPAPWALFGALLLAVAAAPAHRYQVVFGYRYLVLAVLVLLAFSWRIRTGDRRAMVLAGALAGLSLVFRLTPAFAVSLGVAVAVMTLSRSPRDWLRDWTAYGIGLLAVALPVVAWFGHDVGLDVLWREVVVRPVVMTDQQSLPMPALEWGPKHFTRRSIMSWGAAWQFRVYGLVYAVYMGALLRGWWRAQRDGRSFERPLLLAFVIFGGVFFFRTLGRSDAPHLHSAIPPMCLLLAHALWKLVSGRAPRVQLAAAAAAFAVWMLFMGGDVFLDREARGQVPITSLSGSVRVNKERYANLVDRSVALLRKHAGPDDVVLDLSTSPLLQVIADRSGPGRRDLVMPGTFLNAGEEREFVALLEERPPAVVIWPARPFDDDPLRSVAKTAPLVTRWVRGRYVEGPKVRFGRGPRAVLRFTMLLPKPSR